MLSIGDRFACVLHNSRTQIADRQQHVQVLLKGLPEAAYTICVKACSYLTRLAVQIDAVKVLFSSCRLLNISDTLSAKHSSCQVYVHT